MKKNYILLVLILISAISFVKAQYVFIEDPNYKFTLKGGGTYSTAIPEVVSIDENGVAYLKIFNGRGEIEKGITRHLTDGNYDPTFKMTIVPNYMKISNGKILTSENNVVRYLTNGTLDTTFGNNGSLSYSGVINFIHYNADDSFFLQKTNLIMDKFSNTGVLEYSFPFTTAFITRKNINNDFFFIDKKVNNTGYTIKKTNNHGNIDSSFGTNGEIDTVFGEIYINDDGEIFIDQDAYNNTVPRKIYKYSSVGSLDESFGTAGILEINYNDSGKRYMKGKLTFDSQKNIILVTHIYKDGSVHGPRVEKIYFLRVNKFGQNDYTFNNGSAEYSMTGTGFETKDMVMIGDNKLICTSIYYGGLDVTFRIKQFIRYNPLSTEDLQKNTFKIYPNPATSILNISSSGIKSIESMYVSDVTGKKVKEVVKGSSSVNIDKLAKGMYFLQIVAEGKMQSYKFLKK